MRGLALLLLCSWAALTAAQELPPCKPGDMRIELEPFMIIMAAESASEEGPTCYFTGNIVVYYPDEWTGHVSISEHVFPDDLRLRAFTFTVSQGTAQILTRLVLARGIANRGWRLDAINDQVTFRPRSLLLKPKAPAKPATPPSARTSLATT